MSVSFCRYIFVRLRGLFYMCTFNYVDTFLFISVCVGVYVGMGIGVFVIADIGIVVGVYVGWV